MFEFIVFLFVLRFLWFCFANAGIHPDPNKQPFTIPYHRRATPYAARLGRKQVKTDYSGDDWGW